MFRWPPVSFFYEVKCGWVSGIPLCCILWYILFWRFIAIDCQFKSWYYNKALQRYDYKVRYVTCPICLMKRKLAQIKDCDIGVKPCKVCIVDINK